jgi:hypothetical protein
VPLRPKLFVVDGDDPQFEIDLRKELGESPYEVTVECAYAILLSAPPGGDEGTSSQVARRAEASSRAVKRFVRQAENRGLKVEPLRKGYRRLRARLRAR